ncbi:hypothetical protein [Crenothrix polyspora]|uniref:PIN domain-containing protein n=1 Tax=Crenothrix polyspora TaxID=360316 RepID=A0A1R4H9P0_9GAMM|nr:hypothetical protein [Crenothrix polyspora]SJM92929.1 hypothetical protein CRENPOLYSF1_350028 [Crenothrix polyspora]
MKTDKVFFDTNIVLHLLSEDTRKVDRAEAVIALGGVISVQALNEFSSVASRKLKMTYAEIRDTLSIVPVPYAKYKLSPSIFMNGGWILPSDTVMPFMTAWSSVLR